MIEKDTSLCALRLEIKTNEGIGAGIPSGRAPGLNDALIGEQFNVATEDPGAKHGEGASGFAVDVGRLVREGRELFGVEKDGVDASGSGFEIDLLMQGSARGVGGRRRRRGLSRGGKKVRGTVGDESGDGCGDKVAAGESEHGPPVKRLKSGGTMATQEEGMHKGINGEIRK